MKFLLIKYYKRPYTIVQEGGQNSFARSDLSRLVIRQTDTNNKSNVVCVIMSSTVPPNICTIFYISYLLFHMPDVGRFILCLLDIKIQISELLVRFTARLNSKHITYANVMHWIYKMLLFCNFNLTMLLQIDIL